MFLGSGNDTFRPCVRESVANGSNVGDITSSEEDRTSEELMLDRKQSSIVENFVVNRADRRKDSGSDQRCQVDFATSSSSGGRNESPNGTSEDERSVFLDRENCSDTWVSGQQEEIDRLLKNIEQLKVEKQVLVNTVIKMSRQIDEDQRCKKREFSKMTKKVAALKAKCDEYARAQPLIENAVVEVLRSNITDDGLPAIDESVVADCSAAVNKNYPSIIGVSGRGEKDGEVLDIFIDHYNVGLVIEANLAEGSKKELLVDVDDPSMSPTRVSASLSRRSSGESTIGGLKSSGSSGEITAAKIAKLPESYFHQHGSRNISGTSVNSYGSVKDSRMSPSTRSFSSHVSMDSLRRRSMMETRLIDDNDDDDDDDDDDYGRSGAADDQSVISSISEHVPDSVLSPPRHSKRGKSHKGCICGAFRPRKGQSYKPSNYRYYDEEGRLIPITTEFDPTLRPNIDTSEYQESAMTAANTDDKKSDEESTKRGFWGNWFRF